MSDFAEQYASRHWVWFWRFALLLIVVGGLGSLQIYQYTRAVALQQVRSAQARMDSNAWREELAESTRHLNGARDATEAAMPATVTKAAVQSGKQGRVIETVTYTDTAIGAVLEIGWHGQRCLWIRNVTPLAALEPPPLWEVVSRVRYYALYVPGILWLPAMIFCGAPGTRRQRQARSLVALALSLIFLAAVVLHTQEHRRLDREYGVWCGLLLAASLALVIGTHRRERDPTICRVCGYDLRATPARCPECGTAPTLTAR